MTIAEKIKSCLSMRDILNEYVPATIKHDRLPCPLHKGTNYNFQVYEKSYFCWVCKSGGDLIKFVAEYFEITNSEAIEKIDNDFMLGFTTTKQSFSQRRKSRSLQMSKQQQKLELDKAVYNFRQLYNSKSKLHRELLEYHKQYAPLTEGETLHPKFIQSLAELDHLEYWLNENLDNATETKLLSEIGEITCFELSEFDKIYLRSCLNDIEFSSCFESGEVERWKNWLYH